MATLATGADTHMGRDPIRDGVVATLDGSAGVAKVVVSHPGMVARTSPAAGCLFTGGNRMTNPGWRAP